MLRRALWVSLAGMSVLPNAIARPKLGDAEWLRRFGVFLRALNLFVLALERRPPGPGRLGSGTVCLGRT
jgi:hypothetical protein